MLSLRQRRSELFPELRIVDAGWVILLDLLVQTSRGRQVSMESACQASGAPSTTALRHLTELIKQGVLVRTPDPDDGRRHFIGLSPETRERLERYLQAVG
jgi:DNA-binding MarR family transcriptional regulator